MVLPVIKLGSLLVRTISRPIAVRLKKAAVYHPKFRGLIIDLAQVLTTLFHASYFDFQIQQNFHNVELGLPSINHNNAKTYPWPFAGVGNPTSQRGKGCRSCHGSSPGCLRILSK